ncbi:hypothetical protein [Tautonia marina]|uniref:hypothetical protein n=1 Tax=Tautonia marina TaxID=2653855 RepID=UPI0012611313|nr:hypothetical protein [Tautonia marina]
MIAAFIQERGVTVCPPRTGDWTHKATANGHDTPDCSLFRESNTSRTPEQKLAVAKILTMLQDLAGKSHVGASERGIIRWDAERWFFEKSDLDLWCEMAGLEVHVVRAKARDILQNGWPQWRAEAGKGARYEERKAYRIGRKRRKAGLA